MEVITAPAKINLHLSVTGVSSNSYHLLRMVNASIALVDELSVALGGEGFTLECTGEARGTAGEDLNDVRNNILSKTSALFSRIFGAKFGITISLKKNIPVGAGLGGGSSDAAALLMYLARKFLRVSDAYEKNPELLLCAKELGADVPYFLAQSPCLVEGIGETLTPTKIPALGRYDVHIIVPAVQLSTKQVFERFDSNSSEHSGPKSEVSLEFLNTAQDLTGIISNDLLEPAAHFAPVIRNVLEACKQNGIISGLTGSGSALFALSDRGDLKAKEAVLQIGSRFRCRVFSTNFVNT